PEAWTGWTGAYQWGTFYGQTHVGFAPLFGHHYSHVWIDFRRIQDAYMHGRGIDYFENSRRATYAQRAYAYANPAGWRGYSDRIWGLTASDGPGDLTLAMAENHRTELIWRLMRGNAHIVRGLCRAGFTGGWITGKCP